MKTQRQTCIRTLLYVSVLMTTLGCAHQHALTRPEPLVAPQAGTEVVAELTAKDILMGMAEFLAKTPRFSVNLESSYEVLQESGQKIEFGESRKVIVSRPNGLRVEVEHSDGEQHLVQYDGKEITVFSPSKNVYAQTSKPGGIDEAIRYFLRDLGMRLPLAMLLTSQFPTELDRRTQELDYVESTVIDGVLTHHLAGRTETVDYQVWIADDVQPLPLRIVLTYKNAEGQPAYRAQFSNWNLTPEVKDSLFAFTPPKGGQRISFAAELPKIAAERLTNPAKTGGRK
ncbi:DUF2092 domain-containing protein [Nitrosomonas sp. Nm58]|uniref:DUF2092 domain-containing protein n=1 Tax=Nitrosomonas sp. Nm58 TaxID=200126 RepID=UPI0008960BF6|nr:DUF2092 domain-containing protein [Nitrosomonas sp. Nm58]SDY03130.1 hypothetical protein SAMN05421754_1001112 [Nitrosomonas sp. Nm58]